MTAPTDSSNSNPLPHQSNSQSPSSPTTVEWTPEVYRLAELLRDLMYPEGSSLSEVPVLVWPQDEPMSSELLRLRLLRQLRVFAPTTLTLQ